MTLYTIDIPKDLFYTKTHLWMKKENGLCILGWTDYIQSNAGDVNYIELPKTDTMVKIDDEFGSIETSKWVDKLYSPLNGRVVEVNQNVIKCPELINEAPFTKGWFLKILPKGNLETPKLMTHKEYFEYLKICEA